MLPFLSSYLALFLPPPCKKYNKRGKHLGEYNPKTGKQLKPANKTRRVEP
jgi:hypothetical protein